MSDEGTNVDDPPAKPAGNGRKGDILYLLRRNVVNFGVLMGVWSLGYYRFSWSWLCLVAIVMVWRERYNQQKMRRMMIGRNAVQNEKETVISAVRDLPSWVYFPDTERAEWLNKMVKQLWPFIEGYVEKLLRDTVEPAVQKALPSYLKSFQFEKIRLGSYPPRIGGVKVYTEEVGRDEIILDLELFYAGDCDIEMSVKTLKRIKAGLESLQLHGTLRVVMKPLVSKVPLVGGLSIFFLNRPAIDFNLTNMADVLDFPGLSNLLHTILDDQLSYFLVLPNRIPISLIDSVDLDSLKYPMPQGVLRICVAECKNLIKADFGMMKKGKSDPYVVVQVGAQQFKTKIIQNELNPVWNEYFEAIVYEADGQTVDIDVYDEDKGTKDDFIGCLSLDINLFAKQGYVDTWLPLQEIKHGDIHLQMQWLHLTESVKTIDERITEAEKLKSDTDSSDSSRTHAALLVVKLDSAKHLPTSKRAAALPDVFCELKVSNAIETSQIQHQTTSPVWEEAFHFMVQNPKMQSLDIEVKDKRKNKTLGSLTIPLKKLLSQAQMAMDQPFKLDNSGSHSQLVLKLCLRALDKSPASPSADGNKLMVSRGKEEEEEDDIDGGLEDGFSSGPGSPVDLSPPPQSPAVEEVSAMNESQSPTTKDHSQANSPPTIVSSDEDQEVPVNGMELRKRSSKKKSSKSSSKKRAETPPPDQNLVFGKIQLTVRYSSPRNRLIVVIHKAEELPTEDDGDPPDPFVRIYLKPDKSKAGRRKTKEFKKTCSPTFDETFEFMCSAEEVEQRALSVAVKNSSSSLFSMSSKLLGQTEIHLDSLDLSKATTEWYTLKGDQGDNISAWSNK